MTTAAGPLFLMWYDDSPRTPLETKIADARGAYRLRFGAEPGVALVPLDCPDPLPVGAERSPKVRPNTVWVGREG